MVCFLGTLSGTLMVDVLVTFGLLLGRFLRPSVAMLHSILEITFFLNLVALYPSLLPCNNVFNKNNTNAVLFSW